MVTILIDSCFWFALYDKKDGRFGKVDSLYDYLDLGNIIIPYPSLYETINERFAKNTTGLMNFKSLLYRDNFKLLDDSDYKTDALEMTFASALEFNRPLSFVDNIIRLMLSDEKLRINYLITFDMGDFVDICRKRNIEILSE